MGYDPSLGFCEKTYLGSKEKQGMFSFDMKVVNKKCLSKASESITHYIIHDIT
jgi:hypothetical protein